MAYEIRPQSVSLTPSQAYTIYPAPAPAPVFAPYSLEVLIFLLILMPLMLFPIIFIKSAIK